VVERDEGVVHIGDDVTIETAGADLQELGGGQVAEHPDTEFTAAHHWSGACCRTLLRIDCTTATAEPDRCDQG
jgi:hypothetical protein